MNSTRRAALARFPRIVPDRFRNGAVTVGNFDGVHLGHEHVLRRLRQVAGSRPATVVSFYPHPIRVLRRDAGLRYISSIREKAERCGELNVDLLYLVHFTRVISEMSAVSFIEAVFVNALGIKDLVVGEDVAIGRGREGTLAYLRDVLPNYGIALHVVPKFVVGGGKAGSRRIRELLEFGDVHDAAQLIGKPFTVSARVGHGDKRGSALGFPTANIAVGSRLIPKRGVYVCRVEVAGKNYGAVANIGVRPTFRGTGERLEVHILDFPCESLYGQRIHVSFLSRLRDEAKFESVEQLKTQISIDVERARMELARE